MTEQSLGDVVRSANTELTNKADTNTSVTKSDNTDTTERTEQPKWTAPGYVEKWKKTSREKLSKLAELPGAVDHLPDIFKEVDESYSRVKSDYDKYRKTFDPYRDFIPQLEQRFQVQGMHPIQGVQQLMAVADSLQSNPDQTLAWLAQNFKPRDVKAFVQGLVQNYGVNLQELAQGQEWIDPAVQKLIAPLQQQNQQLNGMLQSLFQQQQQAGAAQIQNHLTAFRTAKNDDGSPKYPYLERLEPIMAQIVRATGITDLDALYKKAARLDDETFEQLKEEDARRAEAKAIKDAAERNATAEEAQKASRNVNGATKAPREANAKTLSQVIRANAKKLSST